MKIIEQKVTGKLLKIRVVILATIPGLFWFGRILYRNVFDSPYRGRSHRPSGWCGSPLGGQDFFRLRSLYPLLCWGKDRSL